jgi:hypothetical protein
MVAFAVLMPFTAFIRCLWQAAAPRGPSTRAETAANACVERLREHRSDLLSYLLTAMVVIAACFPHATRAQSPELSMRDFSSGQIKKGVRTIGLGGDGATWGNYGLVWEDAGTGLVDYGDTSYTNGNDFHFSAIGLTSPSLWRKLAIYVIAMSQGTNDVHFNAKSPGLGAGRVPVAGEGSDHAIFMKVAMPLGQGFSAGVLLAHETSRFDATAIADSGASVHYATEWRPSAGFGVAWQPSKTVLVGFRALWNNDLERHSDSDGVSEGLARSAEYRLGASYSPWDAALVDIGGTRLEKHNDLAGTHTIAYHPNVGFEQAFWSRHLTVRFGLDETSPTAGLSFKYAPLKFDLAYVDNMARSRVGNLFGTNSRSILMTFTLDYPALMPSP